MKIKVEVVSHFNNTYALIYSNLGLWTNFVFSVEQGPHANIQSEKNMFGTAYKTIKSFCNIQYYQ